MNTAIVSGTSINRSKVFLDWETQLASTPFGEVEYKRKDGITVVNRHGFSDPLPPHRSNYRGFVHALSELGVESVLSICSVGSLREELPPGSLVSCSDYVSFAPITFIDDAPSGFCPSIDNPLLEEVERAYRSPIHRERIYAQTKGPRFETKAEVKILRNWGCDVVGMTLANECDLLLERGISVTSICVIDNYAHGIGDKELNYDEFRHSVRENQVMVDALLEAFVSHFRIGL